MDGVLAIDGSQGEGGGQVLRTALSLSAILGRPVRIGKIRAGREKPGLKRQHLTCVRAVAEICGADVSDVDVGAMTLDFRPGPIHGGEYRFDIGTAGSVTLVAQTVIPVLLKADAPSSVTITGGTHVPFAPVWEFFAETYLPQLRAMGAEVEAEIRSHGFYPAAGGEIRLSVRPFDPAKANCGWSLEAPGKIRGGTAIGIVSNLPRDIAEEEVAIVEKKLLELSLRPEVRAVGSPGPGNCCMARLDFENTSVVFSEIGTHDRSRRAVANGVVSRVREFLGSGAAAERHLADQLLLPAAVLLCRRGGPETLRIAIEKETRHFATNRDVIAAFYGNQLTN